MKLSLTLLAVFVSTALHAADKPNFVTVPLDQVSGAKPLAGYPATEGWSSVPQGRQVLDVVPFDVLHKLQLAGNTDSRDGRLYVARSLGLPVGQRLARLHLLHAANIPGLPGQPLAALRLHYADGATQTLFIIYGVHVKNYYQDNEPDGVTDADSKLVWKGVRPRRVNSFFRLYQTAFTLRTNAPLESIDAFSLFGKSSLGIFAMTGELADGSTAGTPTPSGDDAPYRDAFALNVKNREGNPVAGARVRGTALVNDTTITLGRMDDSGGEPGVVPVDFPARARELRLVVEANGFVASETVLQAAAGERFARSAKTQLEPGASIGGVVIDPEGNPVEKAKVAIYRVTSSATGKEERFRYDDTTTDRRGRWSSREVPEAMENVRFQITHDDFRTAQVALSNKGAGASVREALLSSKAVFAFENAPTILGTVRDVAGGPLAGIQVTLVRTNATQATLTARMTTDAQGRFTFPEIESSHARIFVNDPRFAPTALRVALDQSSTTSLDITLTTGRPLKLRAIESPTRLNRADGPPIPRVSFAVLEDGIIFLRSNANAQGELVWEKPLQHSSRATNGVEGKILILAEGLGGYRSKSAWIDPNAGEAVFKMEKWHPWKIRAIDAETKEPILNFTTLNSRPPTFADKFGPSRAVNGEALGGYFAETFIHERVLTIESEGYETLRFPLLPELGATNTYELKRKK